MNTLLRTCIATALLVCCALLCDASQHQRKSEEFQSSDKDLDTELKVRRNYTTALDRRPKVVTPRKKAKQNGNTRARSNISCTRLRGTCQTREDVCKGRSVKDKCSGSKKRQCCVPGAVVSVVEAWSVLCAGHHKNRVRACDAHGCGAFNSRRGNGLHQAVDLVCDDYGAVNAPFSGSLAGPVSRTDRAGNQYHGVKLLSDVHCVEIFNFRPQRYIGPVVRGEAFGYVLPLQERFSGITSHLEIHMCDGSDPSPFI